MKNKEKAYKKFENFTKSKLSEPIPASWLQIGATGSSDDLLAKAIPADQMFGADIPEYFTDRLAFFRWWLCRSIMLKNIAILGQKHIPDDIKQILDALESDPEQAYDLFCKYPLIFDLENRYQNKNLDIKAKQQSVDSVKTPNKTTLTENIKEK